MCGLDGVMYEEGWTMVHIYVLEGGYDIKRINQYRVRKGKRVFVLLGFFIKLLSPIES